MQFNEKRMLDRLMEMIRIDSPSFHEKPMTDYLEKYFKDRGYEVYRDEAGSKFGSDGGNVLVHIPGTMEGEAICFNAHQDTVEPGRGIEPVYKDGKVTSAGDTVLGADDKSGIAMLMELLDVIKENNVPHREMYYLFTICEEQGMPGAKNFDISKLPCRNLWPGGRRFHLLPLQVRHPCRVPWQSGPCGHRAPERHQRRVHGGPGHFPGEVRPH